MKLVVLASRFPYPMIKGDKLRLYHQLADLYIHFEVVLITISDEHIPDEHLTKLQNVCHKLYVLPLNRGQILFNLVGGILRHQPLQTAYFESHALKKRVQDILSYEKPDHVYCQLIRMAPYALLFKGDKTIDFMDCFSENSFKRASTGTFLYKWLWTREARLIQKYEAILLHKFNNCIAISNLDAGKIKQQEIGSHITIVPNGISSYFLEPTEQTLRDIDVLFVGNLSYYSNIEAVTSFFEYIYPALNPTLKIVIAGADPTPEIRKQIRKHPTVTLLADVDDIRSVYLRAKVFIAPITKGTGMQNKVLEAIASGCLVLCSKQVKDGLQLELSTFIAIDQYSGFAAAIHDALNTFDASHEQRMKNKALLAENFSWIKQNHTLITLIQNT